MPKEPYMMIAAVTTVVHDVEEEERLRRFLADTLGTDWVVMASGEEATDAAA